MPRNISFAMTTQQIKDKTKTQTRRFGWWFLKPGDVLCGVEKAMGLKKGEKIKRLSYIKVISTKKEPLNKLSKKDFIKESFTNWTPEQFIQMLVDYYKIDPSKECNVIEFEYMDGDIQWLEKKLWKH